MASSSETNPHRWTAEDVLRTLYVPTASDHKYSRGVVALRTGSLAYPGAAVLTTEGAWRVGAGMVRWSGPSIVSPLVIRQRPETVIAAGRADAWVVGSGTDARSRSADEREVLLKILAAGDAPVVIDAGALDLLADVRVPFVITPHDRELHDARIPAGLGIDDLAEPTLASRLAGGFTERLTIARETAIALGGAVLLKGSTTIVATPGGWFATVDTGTPWLATAGTGDVLAGMLGALLASAARRARAASSGGGLDVAAIGPIAATAAWLHGRAGSVAAGAKDGAAGHPITAMEVADAVPGVIGSLLAQRT